MDQIPDHLNYVGPGWRPLLLDLHEQLIGAGFSYELLQQKEKFGILRVYISVAGESHVTFDLTIPGVGTVTGQAQGSSTYDRAMELVHAAEEKSRTICEDCGEPGVLRTERFWLRTLCDACNEEHPRGIVPSPSVLQIQKRNSEKEKEMPVNKPRVRLLVAALKSGLYDKTHGRLHRTESDNTPAGWCCLGVASDVAHKFGLAVNRGPSVDPYCASEEFDGEVSYMPQSVMDWYGFDSNNPVLRLPDGRTCAASTLNDSGISNDGGGYTEVSLKDIGNFFKNTYLKKH